MNAPSSHTALQRWEVVPLLKCHPHEVQEYFQALGVHDTLKYRLSDLDDPKWEDVKDVISRMGATMYLVRDLVNARVKPVAEFTFENMTGRAIQSHFSTHPEISYKDRISIGRHCTRYSLTRRDADTGEYILDALYGLTPLVNRPACIFALKIGYKKQGVLPSGMMYMGKPTDCMISVCTRETLKNG